MELSPYAEADLIASGTIEVVGRVAWSSNAALLVTVAGNGHEMLAVYKPQRGERPLWDFPDGTLCLREVGVGFMFAPNHHPAMKHAAPVRRELGMRTILNILGPLTNPAGAKAQVMGVYDPLLCKRQCTSKLFGSMAGSKPEILGPLQKRVLKIPKDNSVEDLE